MTTTATRSRTLADLLLVVSDACAKTGDLTPEEVERLAGLRMALQLPLAHHAFVVVSVGRVIKASPVSFAFADSLIEAGEVFGSIAVLNKQLR